MLSYYLFFFFGVFIFIKESTSLLSLNKNELLNWCLKGQNHKQKPGKEGSLYKQCLPWVDHACCTESLSHDIHELNLYNFTYDHCFSQVKRNMSVECRKHFIQDNCFYECEPHIGYWVVNTTRKISSERFYKVPLCSSECDSWFEACKEDFTCAYNWPQDFVFKNGHNICSETSKCITFEQMYGNAKEFCENVWDHSWEYAEGKPCMHMSFNGLAGDKNKKAAEFYIDEILGTSSATSSLYEKLGIVAVLSVAISWRNLIHKLI